MVQKMAIAAKPTRTKTKITPPGNICMSMCVYRVNECEEKKELSRPPSYIQPTSARRRNSLGYDNEVKKIFWAMRCFGFASRRTARPYTEAAGPAAAGRGVWVRGPDRGPRVERVNRATLAAERGCTGGLRPGNWIRVW